LTAEEIAVKLEDHEHEIGSLKHRMRAVEEANHALHRLATAVEVMATKQDHMSDTMERLTAKVETLEAEPGKRWKFVVEKAIYFVVAAVVGFMLATVGLKA